MTTIKICKESIKLFTGDNVIIESTEHGTVLYNDTLSKCLFCDKTTSLSKPLILSAKDLLNTSKFKFSSDEIIECSINSDCTQLKVKHNKLVDQINCQLVPAMNEKFKAKLFTFKLNNYAKEKNHIRLKNITAKAKSRILIFRNKYKFVNFQDSHFTIEDGLSTNVVSYHNSNTFDDDKLVDIPIGLEDAEVSICYDKNSIDVLMFINNKYLIKIANNLEPVLQVCNFVLNKIDSLNESKDLTPLLSIFTDLDSEMVTQIKTYIKTSTNINGLMFKLEKGKMYLYDTIRKVDILEIELDKDISDVFKELNIVKDTLMFPAKTYNLISEPEIKTLTSYKDKSISMYVGETDKLKIYSGL